METIPTTPNFEQNPQQENITAADTFEELYAVIDAMGTVHGSRQEYSAAEIKTYIDHVRSGVRAINYITSTSGIREKVAELLKVETAETIAAATDLSTLYETIERIAGSIGSLEQSPAEVIEEIERIRAGSIQTNQITGEYDIRAKAVALLSEMYGDLVERTPEIKRAMDSIEDCQSLADVANAVTNIYNENVSNGLLTRAMEHDVALIIGQIKVRLNKREPLPPDWYNTITPVLGIRDKCKEIVATKAEYRQAA